MRIAIFHGGDLFIKPMEYDWLNKGHDVKKNPNYSYWPGWEPDVVFFEICTNNVVYYTKKEPRKWAKAVVRIHGADVRAGIHRHVDWAKIDDVIFVSKWLMDKATSEADFSKTRTHLILNGVDLEKFTLRKDFTPTYKLAYVGRWLPFKGIDKLDIVLARFKIMDSRYEMCTATGQIAHDDMNAWLEDKDYLIHLSETESFCYAVAEAMAKGIRPLINNWVGAADTFGEEFFVDKFNLEQDPVRIRKIIEDRYDLKRMMKEINEVCQL